MASPISRVFDRVEARLGGGRDIAVAAMGSFLLKISFKVIGFLSTLILARLMGAEGLGTYLYALSLITVISVFGMPSLSGLIVKQMAAYRGSEQWSLVRGFYRRVWQISLAISAFLMLVGGFVGLLLVGDEPTALSRTFFVGLLLLPVVALLHSRAATLLGLNHVVLSEVPPAIGRPLLFLAVFGLLYLILDGRASPSVAMAAQVLGALMALVWAHLLLKRRMPEQIERAQPAYAMRDWSRDALPFLVTGSLYMLHHQSDVLLLGALLDTEAVGIYRPALAMALMLMFGSEAVSMTLRPTVAKRFATGRPESFQRLATYGVRAGFSIAFLGSLIGIFFGDWVLLIFGPQFVEGATALAILCVGRVIYAGFGTPNAFLDMTGHQAITARGLGVAASVGLVLHLILIPRYGIEGAAVAASTSMIVWNAWLMLAVRRRLGIDTTILGGLLWRLPTKA